MTGEVITGSWSIGQSDCPQVAQHNSSAAVWIGVRLPVSSSSGMSSGVTLVCRHVLGVRNGISKLIDLCLA